MAMDACSPRPRCAPRQPHPLSDHAEASRSAQLCKPQREARFRRVERYFSGELLAYEQVGEPWTFGTAVSTFTVERVFKGKLDLTVKVLSSGHQSGPTPSRQRLLVYAVDLDRPGRTALLQNRIDELDTKLSEIQRPLQEVDARLSTTADPKIRAELQALRAAETGNLIRSREALDQQMGRYIEQLTAVSRADVTLQFTACGASVRQLPVPSSLGKGVEPRGDKTDVQPPPPAASWSDPEGLWLAVAAAVGLVALGIWVLTTTRRRQHG